jgi:LysM repeat protein
MFFAALLAVTVQPGQTLSGIASSHGESLAAIEAANPNITNPDLIYAGQTVNVSGGGGYAQWTPSSAPSHTSYSAPSPSPQASPSSSSSTSSASSSGGGLANVPGVPSSFAACVARTESTNGTNQAYNGGVYGIINASGYHVNGQSLAAQKAAFSALYAQYGTAPWHPSDGC